MKQRLVVCLLTAASLVLAARAPAQNARVGVRAPEIDLHTLDNVRVRLSEYQGHPLIVTFWATWCPSCREEFLLLADAFTKHAGDGLRVLAVNERDQEGSDATVRRFLDKFPVPFRVILDVRGRARRDFGILALPMMYFADSAGVIRKVMYGLSTAAELENGLSLIIGARAGRPE